jgi:hypothetical protein
MGIKEGLCPIAQSNKTNFDSWNIVFQSESSDYGHLKARVLLLAKASFNLEAHY